MLREVNAANLNVADDNQSVPRYFASSVSKLKCNLMDIIIRGLMKRRNPVYRN